MLNPMKGRMVFTAKGIAFPNGIYDIYELIDAINTACKVAESYFYFEQQKASGRKILTVMRSTKCYII